MHETTFSHSHLESPATGAARPVGDCVLRGWVWPKPGGHFVDIRARVAGRVFPGLLGWPRPDIAAHFQTGRPWALAGFSIAVRLPPGAVAVALEVLELEGRWSVFQEVEFPPSPAAAAGAEDAGAEQLERPDFCRGLELLLRTRGTGSDPAWLQRAAELAAELPQPHELLPPAPPFIGHADEPAIVNRTRFGRLPVVGYLFHATEKIQRLWASCDLHALQPLTLGRATANLIPHFPQYPAAGCSGYEGLIDVPSQLPNPITVRLYAETPEGKLQLVQACRTRRHDAEPEKFPYVGATAAGFAAALTGWQQALRSRGFTVNENEDYRAGLEQLRTQYLRSPALATPPRPAQPALALPATPGVRPPARITLATHNLNLEGAPLFLLDLARHLAAGGSALTVVSAGDGPLRGPYTALGARIVILDPGPVFAAADEAGARAALATLGRAFAFADTDLVISNTFTTFWAVHLAKAAGRRVVTYVHESTTPEGFYGETLHPAVLALVEESLVLADAVSFTSGATRRYHDRPGRPIAAVLTPGWVDVRRIDAWRQAHPRAMLRARFALQPGELLVTNVGTVCDRKGQYSFVRSVDLLRRRDPALAARTRFVLLGGRQTPFDTMLRDLLHELALPNLEVHPETPDFLPYYAAADLTVCSSFEESSPRVVLEAMACGTPLLASDIPGISELVRDGVEATLVAPGDTTAWAGALTRLLHAPALGQDRAAAARQRVEALYSAEIVLPRHTALAAAVADTGQSAQ